MKFVGATSKQRQLCFMLLHLGSILWCLQGPPKKHSFNAQQCATYLIEAWFSECTLTTFLINENFSLMRKLQESIPSNPLQSQTKQIFP